MPHTIKTIASWKLVTVMFVVSGCTPSEPQPPAPKAVPDAPAKPQAATQQEKVAEGGPELVPPTDAPQEPTALSKIEDNEPQGRTAFYRAGSGPAAIPPVVLSKGHEALCRVKVGDAMPEIVLSRIGARGNRVNLAELSGEKATVVVFWTANRRMAREQLADLRPDVIAPFGDEGVAVVGIAVEESPESAESALRQAKADFPNLLDRDGEAFAKIGSDRLPRTFLLDPQGKILWFDIEYSHATRRELHESLRAVVGEQ